MTRPHHGGDLSAAERKYGAPPAGWIDLSTGISPWPYPLPDGLGDAATRLPDALQLHALRDAAAAAYGAPGAGNVVTAPGTQALIQWLPRLRAASGAARVAVVTPTYGEHAPAWSVAGHAVTGVSGVPDPTDFDVVVVTNPNNPDGRVTPPALLAEAAASLAARGGWLVVDEAFADVSPEMSVVAEMASAAPGVIVLRSFGKFFGLPGLRLGFAVCAPPLATALGEALGPWPVSTAAATVGALALRDSRWQDEARKRLAAATRRLDGLLSASGLAAIRGTTLFRLAEHDDAAALHDRLARAGIYVRHFPDEPRWLRFGLPGDGEEAWRRLASALDG